MQVVSSKVSSIMSKLEQILASSLRKERAIWERERMGEIWEIIQYTERRCINEGERAFIYTWESKVTPLGSFTSVKTQARVII
jgi:hypothetical protein